LLSTDWKMTQLPPETNYSEFIRGFPQSCRHRGYSISIQPFLDSTHLLSQLELPNLSPVPDILTLFVAFLFSSNYKP